MTGKTQNPAYAGMSTEELKRFKYWELRTIAMCIFGYALFYFVRKNLSIAMPYLNEEMGISKSDLGLFLTLHGLIYGLSKFFNGIWGDRSNARYFLVTGLVFCGICNLLFGFSSSVLALGIFWVLNGWFQGMGVPPCTRLMTHWIVPERLATKMSIWNTSHSIGAGLAIIFCGYIVSLNWGAWFDASSILSQHWRWCFLLPATIAILGAAVVWAFVRDTPSSVGLPELKTGKATPAAAKPHTKDEDKAAVQADDLDRHRGQFLRLHRALRRAGLGAHDAQGAPPHGHQPRRMDGRGIRNRRHRGYARRRLGHRPFLRRPRAPHLRDLHADDRALPRGALYPQ